MFTGVPLLCTPNSCSQSITQDFGYTTTCEGFVANEVCAQTCTSGYSQTNAGTYCNNVAGWRGFGLEAETTIYTCDDIEKDLDAGSDVASKDGVTAAHACCVFGGGDWWRYNEKGVRDDDYSPLPGVDDGELGNDNGESILNNEGDNGEVVVFDDNAIPTVPTQRYYPSGAQSSGYYTCPSGHFKGTPLKCEPNDCSSAVPANVGYSQECDNLKTGEVCTQHCLQGWHDNNGGQGQKYTCDGGVFMGVVLQCFPDACDSQLPFAWMGLAPRSYTTSCNGLVTGESCRLECTQGYSGKVLNAATLAYMIKVFVDVEPAEASASASASAVLSGRPDLAPADYVDLTCPDGVIAGDVLFCEPNDCSAANPKGLGYSADCSGLVTDGSCRHFGNVGYTCNDYGGRGQTYSCPQGFWDGFPLKCTADLCTDSVPTGDGLGAECKGLVTDGSCNHTCWEGWEDLNAPDNVQVYSCPRATFVGTPLNCTMTVATLAAAEQAQKKKTQALYGGVASGLLFGIVLLIVAVVMAVKLWRYRKERKAAAEETDEDGFRRAVGGFGGGSKVVHSDFWEKMRAMKAENEVLKSRLSRMTDAWRGAEAPQLPGMAFAAVVEAAAAVKEFGALPDLPNAVQTSVQTSPQRTAARPQTPASVARDKLVADVAGHSIEKKQHLKHNLLVQDRLAKAAVKVLWTLPKGRNHTGGGSGDGDGVVEVRSYGDMAAVDDMAEVEAKSCEGAHGDETMNEAEDLPTLPNALRTSPQRTPTGLPTSVSLAVTISLACCAAFAPLAEAAAGTCIQPANLNGHVVDVEKSLDIDTFEVEMHCATGFHYDGGFPLLATKCSADQEEYSVSGCKPDACVQPSQDVIAPYLVDEKSLAIASFDVPLTCAETYHAALPGTRLAATTCSGDQKAYSVSGCNPDVCQRPLTPEDSGYTVSISNEESLVISTFLVTNVRCVVGFHRSDDATPPAAVKCGGNKQEYTFDGCTADECRTPSVPSALEGYTIVKEISLSSKDFAVEVHCDVGYKCTADEAECTVTDLQESRATATECSSHEGEYALSGCEPQICVRPGASMLSGYTITEISLERPDSLFAVTASCAAGYHGKDGAIPTAAACTEDKGSYTLDGCIPDVCTTPPVHDGYLIGAETSLNGDTFKVEVTCANGYHKVDANTEPAATKCLAHQGAYALAGCAPDICVAPDASMKTADLNEDRFLASRYIINAETSLDVNTFAVSVSCAAGFHGIDPVATPCSGHHTEYSVSGCGISVVFQPVDIPLGADFGASALVAANFGGDENLDIAGVSSGSNTVFWLEWKANLDASNGQYEYVRQDIDSSLKGPKGFEVADIDNDGNLDLVVAFVMKNTLSWYKNKGNVGGSNTHSGWAARADISTSQTHASAVSVADFTGDGKLDIAVGSVSSSKLSFWKQTGSGNFGTGDASFNIVIDETFGGGAYGMKAGSNCHEAAASSVPEDAAACAVERQKTSCEAVKTSSVDDAELATACEWKAADLVVASVADNKLYYYLNGGDGATFARYVLDDAANDVRGIALCDLDGNGVRDIVTASVQDGVSWYKEMADSETAVEDTFGDEDQLFLVTTGDVNDAGLVGLSAGNKVFVTSSSNEDGEWSEIATVEAAKQCYEKLVATSVLVDAAACTKERQNEACKSVKTASATDADSVTACEWRAAKKCYEKPVAASVPSDVSACDAASDAKESCETVKTTSTSDSDKAMACVWKDDSKKRITLSNAVKHAGNVKVKAATWAKTVVDTSLTGAQTIICQDLDGDGDADLAVASDIKQTVQWYENLLVKPQPGGPLFTAPTFFAHAVADSIPGAVAVAAGDMNAEGANNDAQIDLVFAGVSSIKEGIASKSCKDLVPVGTGLNQDCTKLIANHDCTQTCASGFADDEGGGSITSQQYTCTHAGKLGGTPLQCKAKQCEGTHFSMDADAGYGKGVDGKCEPGAFITGTECTHRCLPGYTDNNNQQGQVYRCPGGKFTGSNLLCEPADCTSNVPVEKGMDQGCNSLVTGATCKHMCTAGYDDNNAGQGKVYECKGGVFAAKAGPEELAIPLSCTARDCSGSVPEGGMYATCESGSLDCCKDLKTDGTCVQRCALGFNDNNNGNGQAYSCEGGVFKGTLLTCTPAKCNAIIPTGPGYSSECQDLRTDGTCVQHCTSGFADNNNEKQPACVATDSNNADDAAACKLLSAANLGESSCSKANTKCIAPRLPGEGQSYSCEKGEFKQSKELVCLAEKCTGSLPVGPGFSETHACTALESEQSCVHTCNSGYEDNSGSHGLLGLGKEYSCPSGIRGTPNDLFVAGKDPNLVCKPASCATNIPATASYTEHCKQYKTDGPDCVQYCQYGHYPVDRHGDRLFDDASRTTRYTCKESFLKATGELVCQGESCNEKVPVGPGFGTSCSSLKSDGACKHECTAGYADNNNGVGQAYTCPGRVFTADPAVLTCTANLCNASVPTGVEYTADCSGLMTDGHCVHRCTPGYEDARSNAHGVKLYGDKHLDLTSVGMWENLQIAVATAANAPLVSSDGGAVLDPVVFDGNNGGSPFWKYHRRDQYMQSCKGKAGGGQDDLHCRPRLKANCNVVKKEDGSVAAGDVRCIWKAEKVNQQEWWQPQDDFMEHGKWTVFTSTPSSYAAAASHMAVTSLVDGITQIFSNLSPASELQSVLAPTSLCSGYSAESGGNDGADSDDDCKPYAESACTSVLKANGDRKCKWERQMPKSVYREPEFGYGFKEYKSHANGIGKEIGRKAVIYTCPAGTFTPWKGLDEPTSDDISDVGEVLKCVPSDCNAKVPKRDVLAKDGSSHLGFGQQCSKLKTGQTCLHQCLEGCVLLRGLFFATYVSLRLSASLAGWLAV